MQTSQALISSLKEKIGLKQLIGQSPGFLREVNKIPAIARCDSSVLITGETGTGKEMFARAIHYLGPRAGKPFIPINCGAIPVELVENEIFGHVKGAFTGASDSHPGLIHEANGGTIFLDEIDSLPLQSQVKLLRFLQEKEYKQLGSTKILRADIRVIASSNIEIERAATEGKFRKDLFYRLNIIPVTMPNLRDRKEDIVLLAKHFLGKYASELNKMATSATPDALRKLVAYEWPGNVRELENVIERAVVFSETNFISEKDLPVPDIESGHVTESFQAAKTRVIERFEMEYIRKLLVINQGNITKAARVAQKDRRAFWELIRKHNIDAGMYRTVHCNQD